MTTNINILGKMNFHAFVRDWLEKEPLLINAALTDDQVSELLPRQTLDDLLNRLPLDPETYQVIKNGSVITPAMHRRGGVDPHFIRDEYTRGATLRFTNIERMVPTLRETCVSMASTFMCAVYANVYATPALSTGFNPHYDDRDVFIVQCRGRKMWSLYDNYTNREILPLSGCKFDPTKHVASDACNTFRLSPGDVLYIPRGRMHSATTVHHGWNSESVHVTFGVHWVSVNEVIIDVLSKWILSDPAYRTSLVKLGAQDSSAGCVNHRGCVEKLVDLVTHAFTDRAARTSVEALLNQWKEQYHSDELIRLFSIDDTCSIK